MVCQGDMGWCQKTVQWKVHKLQQIKALVDGFFQWKGKTNLGMQVWKHIPKQGQESRVFLCSDKTPIQALGAYQPSQQIATCNKLQNSHPQDRNK